MRCSCNKNLNDFESTLKDSGGNYLDTCLKCLKGLGIKTIARSDLNPLEAAPPDDWMDVGNDCKLVDDVPYEE